MREQELINAEQMKSKGMTEAAIIDGIEPTSSVVDRRLYYELSGKKLRGKDYASDSSLSEGTRRRNVAQAERHLNRQTILIENPDAINLENAIGSSLVSASQVGHDGPLLNPAGDGGGSRSSSSRSSKQPPAINRGFAEDEETKSTGSEPRKDRLSLNFYKRNKK